MKIRMFLIGFALGAVYISCDPASPMQPNVVTGGRAVAIARHPSNNTELLVASESGGVFKSTDGGVKWKQVTGSKTFWFQDVKYLTSNPTIVIAVAGKDTRVTNGGGIWRSTNSGTDWSQIALTTPNPGCAADLSAYCVAIEPENNKIWVGTSCGVAVSTDSGVTFNFLPTSTNYNNDVVYSILTPAKDQIKMLTAAGVKVSANGGTSWSFSTSGLPYMLIGNHTQIACSPLNHNHIFWAANFSPGDGKWHNGIYYSSDNGANWVNLIDNTGINRPPSCYTAKNLGGNSSKFDLYYSDGGCTFQRAAFTNATPPAISGSWASLSVPHCDHADLCFQTDEKTPLLLAGDGGLFLTTDKGANWAYTGGGPNGYNALQITEVTGQKHSADSKNDLYYGTQDNYIQASADEGATWPDSQRVCCEGFFLNIPRQSLPASQTKITGVNCGACYNFMAAPLFAGGAPGFPNVPNFTNNPCLLKPSYYIQSDTLPGAPTVSLFSLTTNNGASWNYKYAFSNQQKDLSHVSYSASDPVIFTAVKEPGTTPDGQEIIGLKKIVNVLGSGSPIVSDIKNFGSLGIFPTMFAWYKPYAVNPSNPNHIIAPDIVSEKVRVTKDGGMTWVNDDNLTNLVTQSGVFKFRWEAFTQISNIAFDPDVEGRILVGTVQAGIFSTCDNGATWSKLKGTEKIPNVSSFYFLGDNKAVVSSYGRGLWKLSLKTCPSTNVKFPPGEYQLEEPLIWWKGAYVPISQIGDPEVCPVCGYFLLDRGDITEIILTENNVIKSVSISEGTLKGYTYDETIIESIPFRVSKNGKGFDAGKDEGLIALMRKGYKIKGLYVKDNILNGYIVAKNNVQVNQLPKKQEFKTYLRAELIQKNKAEYSVKIRGKGFSKAEHLVIKVDGKAIDMKNQNLMFDENENMSLDLNYLLTPGGHTILVQQGKVKEVTTVIIPLNDRENREH